MAKEVTVEQLTAIREAVLDLCGDARDYANRIERNTVEAIENPIDLAMGIQTGARALLDLSAAILYRARLDEMKRETEALIRAHQVKAEA